MILSLNWWALDEFFVAMSRSWKVLPWFLSVSVLKILDWSIKRAQNYKQKQNCYEKLKL